MVCSGDALVVPSEPNCGDVNQAALNMAFTTYDADHDTNPGNCAVFFYQGAWWYGSCLSANLNGLYLRGSTTPNTNGASWCPWKGLSYAMKTIEMKIKPYYGI